MWAGPESTGTLVEKTKCPKHDSFMQAEQGFREIWINLLTHCWWLLCGVCQLVGRPQSSLPVCNRGRVPLNSGKKSTRFS